MKCLVSVRAVDAAGVVGNTGGVPSGTQEVSSGTQEELGKQKANSCYYMLNLVFLKNYFCMGTALEFATRDTRMGFLAGAN